MFTTKLYHNGVEYEWGEETIPTIDFLLIGGGGGGGCCYGAGGGGGEVLVGEIEINRSANITIGDGGLGAPLAPCNGGNTLLDYGDGVLTARGGFVGSSDRSIIGGTSGSGCLGGGGDCPGGAGGGGGATSNGGNATATYYGGPGGYGLFGYGGGGGGSAACSGGGIGRDGGGDGGRRYLGQGCPASNYGGGGGGGFMCCCGGAGGGGLAEICYPLDGSYGFTTATGGDECYVCDGYCVHRFTSDGTFTIVS